MDKDGILIRPATIADADFFPAIENSAGLRFAEHADLAWLAEGEDRSVAQYRGFVADGVSWAAVDRSGQYLGFLCGGLKQGGLHIWEFAVCREHQGRGIGRLLMETAIQEARNRGLRALTLTTFSEVAWNAPLYRRWGFNTVPAEGMAGWIKALLEDEEAHGLPRDSRCAMQLDLSRRAG